jgi:hypothetical protein
MASTIDCGTTMTAGFIGNTNTALMYSTANSRCCHGQSPLFSITWVKWVRETETAACCRLEPHVLDDQEKRGRNMEQRPGKIAKGESRSTVACRRLKRTASVIHGGEEAKSTVFLFFHFFYIYICNVRFLKTFFSTTLLYDQVVQANCCFL